MSTSNIKHIAFFSQTGSEIVKISEKTGKFPDLIITDGDFNKIHKEIPLNRLVRIPKKLSKNVNLLNTLLSTYTESKIITLHGWLNIIPKEICETYNIYNGHPGHIVRYPELKGKDPQKRAFEGKYPLLGCVIHKVIPEVDEGSIISIGEIENVFKTEEQLVHALHTLSVNLWVESLKKSKTGIQ